MQRRKLAFLNIVGKVKGFVKTIEGKSPLIVSDCVDEKSLINFTITGAQGGVGDKTANLFDGRIERGNILGDGTPSKFGYQEYYRSVNFIKVDTGYKIFSTSNLNSKALYVSYYDTDFNFIKFTAHSFIQEDVRKYCRTNITEDVSYIKFHVSTSVNPATIDDVQIQICEGSELTDYEPYGYKIPIIVSNGEETKTTNIYLDMPVSENESLSYFEKQLPLIPIFKGSTTYKVETNIQPESMKISYYSTTKG